MKKTYMFQYYDGYRTIEDTDLITEKKANELWDKYFDEAKDNLQEGLEVQMCIWKDCENAVAYHTIEKEIDYRDCVVENGTIYKITKERIA